MTGYPGKQCKDCRYPLDQLRSRTCPECGRAFDPDDPATFRTPGDQQINIGAVAVGLLMFILLAPLFFHMQLEIIMQWHGVGAIWFGYPDIQHTWGVRDGGAAIFTPLASLVLQFQFVLLTVLAGIMSIVIGRQVHRSQQA